MITIHRDVFKEINSDTNALTESVVLLANNNGYKAWRQNNIAAPNRRFTGQKGVPDVLGYHLQTGRFLALEIKRKGDRKRKSQIEFIEDAKQSNVFCGFITKYEDALELFAIEYKYN